MPDLEIGDAQLLTPAYWNGADITDDRLFADVQPTQDQQLDRRQRQFIDNRLKDALGQVIAGNATEVHYGANNEFNPDLPDGSVVAIDHEALVYFDHTVPGNVKEHPSSKHAEPPITRPYTDYWLNNQGGEWNGSHTVGLPEGGLAYVRSLSWGVFLTSKGQQAIAPAKQIPDIPTISPSQSTC